MKVIVTDSARDNISDGISDTFRDSERGYDIDIKNFKEEDRDSGCDNCREKDSNRD